MSIICCPDCGEENFSSAEFCRKCGADFNRQALYSRFFGKPSVHKTGGNAILVDTLDVLDEYGGPWGFSLRLNRSAKRAARE